MFSLTGPAVDRAQGGVLFEAVIASQHDPSVAFHPCMGSQRFLGAPHHAKVKRSRMSATGQQDRPGHRLRQAACRYRPARDADRPGDFLNRLARRSNPLRSPCGALALDPSVHPPKSQTPQTDPADRDQHCAFKEQPLPARLQAQKLIPRTRTAHPAGHCF